MYRYRLKMWRDDSKFNLKLKSHHIKQHTTYGALLNIIMLLQCLNILIHDFVLFYHKLK